MRISTHKEFKMFFDEHYAAVCRFVLSYTGNVQVSEDITQDAFIRTYERREEFDATDNARAFIYTTAHNLSLDYLKRCQVRSDYNDFVARQESPAEEQSFLKEVTRQETIRLLHQAIDELPQQTRLTILYTLGGHTNNEIADLLHISVNTVKTLKKNGYSILRQSLSKDLLLLLILMMGNIE